jgi:hypothetical protein
LSPPYLREGVELGSLFFVVPGCLVGRVHLCWGLLGLVAGTETVTVTGTGTGTATGTGRGIAPGTGMTVVTAGVRSVPVTTARHAGTIAMAALGAETSWGGRSRVVAAWVWVCCPLGTRRRPPWAPRR